MQQEREREANWQLQNSVWFGLVFRRGYEMLLMVAEMHQMVSISKDLKIRNLLKDPSELYTCLL